MSIANDRVAYFAETDSRNKRVKFGIKASDRTRHVYIIGKTGMGKSTLLENMAVQDMQNGDGMAFIDPHGKTAELLLDYVPESRIKDVVYFAPFDLEHPISFNVMEDVGYERRHLVANGLMSAFKKIWVDAWSARMEYILNNILLSLLEFPDSTLIGVNRMLVDKEYRKKVVDNITDPSVKAFWTDEFAKYGDRYMQEAGAAIQNKIGQFISNPMVRNIIGQTKSSFDIRKLMDEKKILIVNLSKGRVGEGNANLLGSMLITKIYLAAMSRADASPALLKTLPNFYLYVDEFQSFANESFADILSEARKYNLNLTIAHQYIEQMSEEVRAAVFGNVGSMISFRVGAFDAEVLEKEFGPQFTAQDLVNLGFVQIYLKLMIDGVTSPPFSATTLPPIAKPLVNHKHDIIEASRAQFTTERVKVEAEIREWHRPIDSRQDTKQEPRGEKQDIRQEAPRPKQEREIRLEKPAPKPIEKPPVHAERKENPLGPLERKPLNRTNNREADLMQTISQSYTRNNPPPSEVAPEQESLIKKDEQRNRPVKDDGTSALKKALEAVLAAQRSAPQVQQAQPQPVAQKPVEAKVEPKKSEPEKPKEVPEDVLRNILKME